MSVSVSMSECQCACACVCVCLFIHVCVPACIIDSHIGCSNRVLLY